MKPALAAIVCGLLFGIGLTVSGMADPMVVLGFLRLAPGWNPALMLVMGGAVAVALPGFAWLKHRRQPWLGGSFAQPPSTRIDGRLVVGAALFGIGWGLAGFCPGPAIVSFGLLQPAALLFLPAMLLGAGLARLWPASAAVGPRGDTAESGAAGDIA